MLIKMPHFSEYSDDEPFLRADYLSVIVALPLSESGDSPILGNGK